MHDRPTVSPTTRVPWRSGRHSSAERVTPPERVIRALVAVVAAIVATNVTWHIAFSPTDFHFYYRGAYLWLHGVDPYAMRPRAAFRQPWPLWDRLFYPLPALLIIAPFTLLPMRLAQAAFIGCATGGLAWRLSRAAWWPLLVFCTPSFFMAAVLGQWSPWLTLAALAPTAGFLLAAKPTLGLACFAYSPSWRAVGGALVIGIVSLLLMPRWPVEWLDNLHTVAGHRPPISSPGGFLIVLALFRWRQPEARFLLAMACVPQLAFFADQVPLFLTARTRLEGTFYAVASTVVFVVWLLLTPTPVGDWYILLGCYWPALYMVLRRPNEGTIPAWLELRLAHWPTWLRGRPPLLCA